VGLLLIKDALDFIMMVILINLFQLKTFCIHKVTPTVKTNIVEFTVKLVKIASNSLKKALNN
jgi:hypothetical protein